MRTKTLRYVFACAPGPLIVLHELAPADTIKQWLVALCVMALGFPAIFWRPTVRLGLAAALSLVLGYSVLLTRWPFELAFRWSEPAMDRAAERILAGESSEGLQRVGWFFVREAGLNARGEVCLWTDLAWAGPTGFVIGEHYNLWETRAMSERWNFLTED